MLLCGTKEVFILVLVGSIVSVIFRGSYVLGALLQYVLDPSVYLIGCSAGVYALIAAHVSNIIIVRFTVENLFNFSGLY